MPAPAATNPERVPLINQQTGEANVVPAAAASAAAPAGSAAEEMARVQAEL